MKLSSTMKYALSSIARRSTGRGRRGLLFADARSYGISLRTIQALYSRGLATARFTRFGTGYREVVKATPKGQKAFRSFIAA